MKLHLDPAEFIGLDFFAGLADDDGGLRPLDARLRSDAGRTKNSCPPGMAVKSQKKILCAGRLVPTLDVL